MKATNTAVSAPTATTLSAQYLRDVKALTFSHSEVRVVFKNAPVFSGPIEGLAEHTKRIASPAFADSTLNGVKIGIFPTFIPTTKEQRAYLAAKIGTAVEKGKAYTFATIWTARQFAKELKAAGIDYKACNFGFGHTDPAATRPQPEADAPPVATEELPM